MASQNKESQHSDNTTIACTNCNKHVWIQSNFCNYCGTKLIDLKCDEYYQKQISMKQQKQRRTQEHQKNEIKLSNKQEQQLEQLQSQCLQKHEEQNKRSEQLVAIQEKITRLQQQIRQHREQVKKQNSCWKFGFDFSGDYGDVWSSTQYWHLLITSNQRICTDNMHFVTRQQPCSKCNQNIQILQECKQQWQNKIVEHYAFLKKI